MNIMRHIDVRIAASAVAFAAHSRFHSESPAQATHHEADIWKRFDELLVAMHGLEEPEDGATYLLVDEDGTFREAQRGQTRESVIADIATGECEVEQVLRLKGGLCQDVTDAIAAEILAKLHHDGPGRILYIPGLLIDRLPDDAAALERSWMTPEERRADAIEARADELRDERLEHMLEAAE